MFVFLLLSWAPPLPPSCLQDFEADAREFLEAHCIECHGGRQPAGDLDLVPALDEDHARRSDELDWEYLRERVDYAEMPPRGRPRPPAADTDRFLAWIDAAHQLVAPADRPLDPGRPVLRRLNHNEYRNTVLEALGVAVPVDEWFPAETVGYGFDSIGESLTLSDALFEKYLQAAERIAGEAWTAFGPEHVSTRRYLADELEADGHGGYAVLAMNGIAEVPHRFPSAGRYRLRIAACGQQAGPEPCRMAAALDGELLEEFEVPGELGDVGIFESEVTVARGLHAIGGAFVNDYWQPDDPDPAQRDRNLLIAWVELHGPLEPPPATALQAELAARFAGLAHEERLRAVLAELAQALWRRPPTYAQLERLVRSLGADADFDTRVQDALVLLLVSPDFLFRFERDHDDPGLAREARRLAAGRELPPGVVALDGHELAVRLAYFLWSGPPDTALRELAASGALLSDAVLREQTTRLLADPRAWNFTRNFAGQWLQLRKLERLRIDEALRPDFDEELRAAMVSESLRLFDALLHEERDLRGFLDADFSFVNARLARHYGLEFDERGAEWQRLALPPERRGLLGHASILTLTSEPTRSSPVKRGKWLLATLLGAPPAAPPVNAGSFENNGVGASAASLREQLAEHRARAECAVCHDAMDPLGLALENFGPLGRWRDEDQGLAIDAGGEFPDGRRIEGPAGLRAILRDDPAFVRALLTQLYVYALGRPTERADRALLDELLQQLDPLRPTLVDAIHGIVQSPAFRLRRGRW